MRGGVIVAIIVAAVVCAYVWNVPRVEAHGDGLSWVATSSPYVVDVGYDPNEFQAGLSARFDFILGDELSGETIEYDHVWVRLIRAESTVLATGIRQQQLGPTTLLYKFAEPGDYKIEVSFRDVEGNDLAVASFPFDIIKGSSNSGSFMPNVLMFLFGACVGALGFFMWSRRSKAS